MNLEIWDQKIKALSVRSNFTTWIQKEDEKDSVQPERLCITLQQETILQSGRGFGFLLTLSRATGVPNMKT